MFKPVIPPFCQPCIVRLQAACPHLHTNIWGNWHFSAGEVWDDLTEVCDDCGANLDALVSNTQPNPNLTQEKIPCQEN